MSTPRLPREWFSASDKLNEFLKTRMLTTPDLCIMVAKSTGQPLGTVRSPIYGILHGRTVVSYIWVVIARTLGIKLSQILDNREWVGVCELAYSQWIKCPVGEKSDRAMITQAIWTNKITGEQIDPATATQAKEDQPMKSPVITPTNTTAAPAPSIVELAAQFEVAQKRLAAAAAEHKAAQDALETLRAQLTAAIKP